MIKRLSRCVREYWKPTLLAPLFMILEVTMEVLIPGVMSNLLDFGVAAGNNGYVIRQGLLLIACALASLLFGCVSADLAAKASTGFAANLRHDMYYTVQEYSFSNIDRFSTASIVTRLTTDVTNIQMAFQMCIRMAIRSPVMLIFALIMAFRIHAQLALIYLAALPVMGVGLYVLITHAHPIFERVFSTYDKLNNVVQENLRGIRVVKSFVREKQEERKFNRVSDSIYRDFTRAERIMAFNNPIMQFTVYATILLISWFGAKYVVASGNSRALGMTTAQLNSLFTYTMQILSSLMMLSMVFVMLTISKASAERVTAILDEKPDIVSPANAVRTVADGSIDFDHVGFSYKGDADKLCLSNIDLHIRAGQTVGILGGTGSSKSTLVQLIPRLYDATCGSVRVGGIDVRRYELEALRDQVAMVLQKNVLFSGTIRENLRWGCADASDDELVRVCRLAQADDFIRQFPDGYDTYIEQGGSNVSGGQKQRLCIARALLKKPKILILDDSTSAVDTRTDALIRKAFAEEIPDTTKLIIAQRVSSVENADLIIVMDGGRIHGMGTHTELLKSDTIYREVYESQTKGGGQDAGTENEN